MHRIFPSRKAITKVQASALVVVILVAIIGASFYISSTSRGPSSVSVSTMTSVAPLEINIAGIYPLTGTFAIDGQLLMAGAQQAVNEINAQGGIQALGGARLVLRVIDSGSTVDSAVSATQRLLSQYNISVCAECSYASALTFAEIPIGMRNHVPWITLSLADTITSQQNPWVFDTSPLASQMAVAAYNNTMKMAAMAGITSIRLGLLATTDPSSQAEVVTWASLAKNASIPIVYQDSFQPGIADATTIALQIKAAQPNVLLMIVSSAPDNIVVMNALAQQGVKIAIGPVGGGDYLVLPPIGQALGSKANGLSTVTYNFPTSRSMPIANQLAKALNVTFIHSLQLQGYSAVYLFKAAAEYARSAKGDAIRDALASMTVTSGPLVNLYPTTTHTIHFVAQGPGNGYRLQGITPLMAQWQNGIPVCVYPTDFATAKLMTP